MRRLWTLLAACALTLTPLAPAAAADHTPDRAHASLVLTLTDTRTGDTDAVTLRCRPTGGTHPDPWHACRELDLVGGDFDALAPTGRPCTDEYDPVRAYAFGHWAGQPVFWSEWFVNPCVAGEDTAGVFRF